MRTHPSLVAAALAAAAVFSFVPGCGRGGDGAATGGPAAQSAPGGSARAAKNACALVDRAQLESIAAEKLDMMHTVESDDHTVCELTATGTDTLLVSVGVYWRGGREEARTSEMAMGLAKRLSGDADIEALTGSGDVKGLADKAYYSDLMPSWFLKGDVLVQVIAPRFGNQQTKAVFLSVARSAAAKL